MSSRDLWTSRLGFILASAGAAVGLGAITFCFALRSGCSYC